MQVLIALVDAERYAGGLESLSERETHDPGSGNDDRKLLSVCHDVGMFTER